MKANALLTLTDTNENRFDKRLPNLNPQYMPDYGTDTVPTNTAVSIKAACESLISLTSNTLNKIAVELAIDISDVQGGEENG